VELVRAAIDNLLHFPDWMLLPQLQLLALFVIPGLFLWFRRAPTAFGAAGWCGLAVLATYTWHFRFADGRYLLFPMPLIVVAALSGLAVIPHRIRLLPALPKIPLRGPILFLAVAATFGYAAYSQIRPKDNIKPKDVAQYRAGLWLAEQKPGRYERAASSRMTVAYYAGVFPVDMRRVFDVDAPYTKDQVAPALRQSNCQWLVWLDINSKNDHPQLAWLATEQSFPGCDLVYRRDGVSIWKVHP